MSFRCDFCNKPGRPNTDCTLVTTKVRPRVYEENGNTYFGNEIVQQKKQCIDCFSNSPEEVTRRMNDGRTYSSALRFS